MKLVDIHNLSLRGVSNKELLGLHRRTHQLWVLSNTKKYNKPYIKNAHDSIVYEMESRGMNHNTPLKQNVTEAYLIFLNL